MCQPHVPWELDPCHLPTCPPPLGLLTLQGLCWHPAHPPRTALGVGLRTGQAPGVAGQRDAQEDIHKAVSALHAHLPASHAAQGGVDFRLSGLSP